MLLRRVTEHVKVQNWFAVAIDLVIVVVGVFIGIQVANWNDERVQKLQERSYLAQLRDEIASNDQSIENQLKFVGNVIAGGRRALDHLQSADDCVTGCEALLIDFFHASQLWGTPFVRAKFEETQRLGFPSKESTRAAVDEFYGYIDGWDAVTASPPPYRERVRGHITPDAAEVLWRGCWHSLSARFEELRRDCEEELKPLGAAAMLGTMRADVGLRTELRFWLGQNIFAARGFPRARHHAQLATAAISRELGVDP